MIVLYNSKVHLFNTLFAPLYLFFSDGNENIFVLELHNSKVIKVMIPIVNFESPL